MKFIFFWFRKTCGLCQAPNPVKKCSKSHSRCKGILFCNKDCEKQFCKKQKEIEENQKKPSAEEESEENENINGTLAKEMSEAAKAEKAKKKKAKKAANKEKKSGDGAFWWNNSVYASW